MNKYNGFKGSNNIFGRNKSYIEIKNVIFTLDNLLHLLYLLDMSFLC